MTFYGEKGKLWVNRNRYEFYTFRQGCADRAGEEIPRNRHHCRPCPQFPRLLQVAEAPQCEHFDREHLDSATVVVVQSYEEQRRSLRFGPVRLEVLAL